MCVMVLLSACSNTQDTLEMAYSVEKIELGVYNVTIDGITTKLTIPDEINPQKGHYVFQKEYELTAEEREKYYLAQDAVCEWVRSTKGIEDEDRESVLAYIMQIPVKKMDFPNSVKEKALWYDGTVCLSTKLRVSNFEWALRHELTHAVAEYLRGGDNRFGGVLLDEAVTDLITAQIVNDPEKAHNSGYADYVCIPVEMVGIFGEETVLKSYFYDYYRLPVPENELNVFIHSVTEIPYSDFACEVVLASLDKWSVQASQAA